jgi:hypothetical protein
MDGSFEANLDRCGVVGGEIGPIAALRAVHGAMLGSGVAAGYAAIGVREIRDEIRLLAASFG